MAKKLDWKSKIIHFILLFIILFSNFIIWMLYSEDLSVSMGSVFLWGIFYYLWLWWLSDTYNDNKIKFIRWFILSLLLIISNIYSNFDIIKYNLFKSSIEYKNEDWLFCDENRIKCWLNTWKCIVMQSKYWDKSYGDLLFNSWDEMIKWLSELTWNEIKYNKEILDMWVNMDIIKNEVLKRCNDCKK